MYKIVLKQYFSYVLYFNRSMHHFTWGVFSEIIINKFTCAKI